jgi:hypothetical protein
MSLEGGINKQLKDLAGSHRGMFDEHQRIAMDWWLYLHTDNPTPPLELARNKTSGESENEPRKPHGRKKNSPGAATRRTSATYDTGIETEWNPSVGVRKGWAGR